MRLIAVLATLLTLGTAAQAQCVGKNLIDALPADDRAALTALTEAQPFATGNFWLATKGTQTVHLIGTYHFDDPRHAATLATLTPLIAGATTLLVEAGPVEEQALKDRIARDPGVLIRSSGKTLPEQVPEAEWQAIAAAATARGIPPFMAAKLQPWYLAVSLGIPPCAMAQVLTGKGLDAQIIAAATAAGIPVAALEPYDTIFRIFDRFSPEDQVSLIRASLATEHLSTDMAVTTADAYFREDTRLIWELTRLLSRDMPGFTPAELDAEFARMEDALMITRNRAWIPVIEAAAAKGPVLAAFGALHLSGQSGVLALLQQNGWTLTRQPL